MVYYATDVEALVYFWKKKGLEATTIMNYLADLRYFFRKINHHLEHIDNQSLHLSKSRNRDGSNRVDTHPVLRNYF